jgi:hypothetical protein
MSSFFPQSIKSLVEWVRSHPEISKEVLRAFRYGRDLSLIAVVKTEEGGAPVSLDNIVSPYVRTPDIYFELGPDIEILILPETSADGAKIVASRILEGGPRRLPGSTDTSLPEIRIGMTSIGLGGHSDIEVTTTALLSVHAAIVSGHPMMSFREIFIGNLSLLESVAMIANLTPYEVSIFSQSFERFREEPMGFRERLAQGAFQIAKDISMNEEDAEDLARWAHFTDLSAFEKGHSNQKADLFPIASRRKRDDFLKGMELYLSSPDGANSHEINWKTRWKSKEATGIFHATNIIQKSCLGRIGQQQTSFPDLLAQMEKMGIDPSVIASISKKGEALWNPLFP